MIRAAVIGLGVGEAHIDGYNLHPECTVTTVYDLDATKTAEVLERRPELRAAESAEAVLADPQIDVVSIAGYDTYHAEQILRAFECEKHVFSEKPLCLSYDELRSIREALDKRPHLHLSSNLILRGSPRFRRLRADIQAGRLGTLFHLEGSYNYGRVHKLTEGWRGRVPYYSVTLGGGLHLVDLLHWCSGDRITTVAGFGGRLATEGTQFRFADTTVAAVEFASGATGKVASNFSCVEPHYHEVAIYGTQASFHNDRGDALLYVSRDPDTEPERISEAYPGTQKGDLIPGFIDQILGRGVCVVSAEDVFEGMCACLSIDRALAERRVVEVEYV